MLYFVTVNYHSSELVAKLLSSIQAQEISNYKLIIVNNSPIDRNITQLASAWVEMIDSPENIGFGRACNLALESIWRHSQEAVVWLINPDAELAEGSIETLTDIFRTNPEISILGTTVCEPDRKLCFCGGKFEPRTGLIAEIKTEVNDRSTISNAPKTTDWVSGCSLILNFKQFRALPYFDRAYFLYYEDFDFCRRYAKQGHHIYISDRIQVIHQTSSIASRNLDLKIKYEISSYLLSLERHTSFLVLMFRSLRITLVAIMQLFVKPKLAICKLQGIWIYLQISRNQLEDK